MKISWNWLKTFVDLSDVTPKEVASRLTFAGVEVDAIAIIEIDGLGFSGCGHWCLLWGLSSSHSVEDNIDKCLTKRKGVATKKLKILLKGTKKPAEKAG